MIADVLVVEFAVRHNTAAAATVVCLVSPSVCASDSFNRNAVGGLIRKPYEDVRSIRVDFEDRDALKVMSAMTFSNRADLVEDV